ncbi:MAG: hypothetical protein EOO07_07080 [Chitinophagaceae bacterium]|nr:MAG: hypothetical protein EOO07_07080 [Chitinophagaceae bacterium]
MNIFLSDNPENIIRDQQTVLLAGADVASAFAIRFNFHQYYLAVPASIELVAIVHLKKSHAEINISCAIFLFNEVIKNQLKVLPVDFSALKDFANQHQTPLLTISNLLVLDPIKIPKPWGQEIWYTGIETRGQSNISAQGFTTPLPWVLALMPEYLANGLEKKITLLKTLDPLPDEVYGDLYFELHEEKQEVYIVTHIDEQAWSDKTGAIRLGFDRQKRAKFACDDDFKIAYLRSVREYEKVRRQIDALLDAEKRRENIGVNEAIDARKLKTLSVSIPRELILEEKHLRSVMDSFTALRNLQIGDVVKIPCLVPHALQHGVRTVEFQTPVYERKILSFAQKVLTQEHWDTEAALAKSLCDTPDQAPHHILVNNDGVHVEEIVNFDYFSVMRISIVHGKSYQLPAYSSYGLLMSIKNTCQVEIKNNHIEIQPETAVFLPHAVLSNTQKSILIKAYDAAVQVLLAVAH